MVKSWEIRGATDLGGVFRFIIGIQKRKFSLRGRALPLMTSSGAKKLILAEFYGFSGLRKTLFWKNYLGIFITVGRIIKQKRTLNSKIVFAFFKFKSTPV